MHITKKEFQAVYAAHDMIAHMADGADPENYPQDVLDGLYSIFTKYKEDKFRRAVNRRIKKLRKQNNV